MQVVAGLALLLAAGSCVGPAPPTTAAVSTPSPAPATSVDPALPGLGADDVTRLTVDALQDYWRQEFPRAFGTSWQDVRTIAPVHVDAADAPPPPCVAKASDLRGNAFYCPGADAIVWDDDVLVPGLRDRFGPAGVVVVLAHEFGHAVETRLGVDALQRSDPAGHPTILLEAMADCFAGAAIRHFVDATAAGGSALPLGTVERDAALRALMTFRDPLGTLAADTSAHGNSFDRISAVEDGYSGGPSLCARMTVENRQFTQRRFGSAADRARGGNLPLNRLVAAVSGDARGWYEQLVAARGVQGWRAPEPRSAPPCPGGGGDQGPVTFCADGAIVTDLSRLADLEDTSGDFAGATLLASRYALAARAGAGLSTTGFDAGRSALCLTGAYTARLVDPTGGFGLSPGDLDEAVGILLDQDWAETDGAGTVDPADHGFDRVARFRQGFTGGPATCGL
ncbi:metalloprotease-like protein [Pseudonocardia dioxanivorans CB1190]|uniref:Metalloprotease-like protein n=1 Tax=Pseudonocardia dioxanivorans (strain ATCC 55486 / DSM 44775 / JCM 13855 / CB1190) TaxID=675635 RepID=F4CKW5_PSEUX|nr:neutral zinc metallopeptidase [Pseudonocardia dioxanivorans]AEA23958.1 metalloprotease-like protein [Pseudonocardia dioxanivorans CB1190]